MSISWYCDIVILMKKQCFQDDLMAAAILDLARTSLTHYGSCHQGGFRREDIVFCWCLQWKSYFVVLFGNKVDRNRHIWRILHVVELVRMPLTVFWGSFLPERKMYFANMYGPPHIDMTLKSLISRLIDPLHIDDIPRLYTYSSSLNRW